jgi:glutaredoxin 3
MIKIYTKNYCGFCFAAKNLLTKRGLEFEEIEVTHDTTRENQMRELSGGKTVPQIFFNDKAIGGYAELLEMDMQGQLESAK